MDTFYLNGVQKGNVTYAYSTFPLFQAAGCLLVGMNTDLTMCNFYPTPQDRDGMVANMTELRFAPQTRDFFLAHSPTSTSNPASNIHL